MMLIGEDRDVGEQGERRSAVNAPRMRSRRSPAAGGGGQAAEDDTSSTSRIGIEIASARPMSALTWSLMSWLTRRCRRSATSARARARVADRRDGVLVAASSANGGPRRSRAGRCSPARQPVPQKVVVRASRSCGTSASDSSTALRNAGSSTVACRCGRGRRRRGSCGPAPGRRPRRPSSSRCPGPRTRHRSSRRRHRSPTRRRTPRTRPTGRPPSDGGGTSLGRGPRTWRLQC